LIGDAEVKLTFVEMAGLSHKKTNRPFNLLNNRLGEDPETDHRVNHHQNEHWVLAFQDQRPIAKRAYGHSVGQVYGQHVPQYNQTYG
jgi:hypothetical protein